MELKKIRSRQFTIMSISAPMLEELAEADNMLHTWFLDSRLIKKREKNA